ncbi:phosphonate ABC transporter periplasmic phosphonate-binding protein [Halorubrum aidingense JCM 13560]|uniref:Phosphonate ABC transporter periplasmic phosphonate-binding protein n=1 Tax=Halorubrum aidingense JCM 13560 TaxID=1230454 RepID=M0PA18_9EURY|nr:phosphate/phosphite/phosphonate ABC transporter substrate-binding protein [Halorubrum aidingense]EMA66693.1 phosphonate ABC transporter periplasmic phosphonate-binding protein [Halorubrum aidingense JCM 13560]
MVEHTGERTETSSRRRFILAGGAVGIAGVAGCTGGGGDGAGGDGAGAGLESSSEDGGDGSDGGDGDDGGSGDPMLTDASEFDPAEPNWEENNYLMTAIAENDYFQGSSTDLENMQNRDIDEVAHGEPPRELPEDESDWVDPDELVFVDKPGESGEAQFQETIQPMLDRIEETTGRSVRWQPVDSNAASVEALRSGRAHLGNVSTGTTAFAVNLGGAVPFADPISPTGQFGYRLLAITRADMDEIQSVEDFPDYDVAHTEPASNSGNQAPSALFDQYFDVTPGEDYEVEFSGGHDQSGRGISVGDYDCGPICSTCVDDLIQANDDMDYDDFKVVWASNPFPPGPVVHRYNLHPDLVEGIKEAYIETDWTGTDYAEATGEAEYVPIDYKTVFNDIMVIQRYNGVEYESGNL